MHPRAILASAALVIALPSCQSALLGTDGTQELAPRPQATASTAADWYYRAGVYAGYAEVDDDVNSTLDGMSGGGRLELGTVKGSFELGGRVSLGMTSTEVSDSLAPQSSIEQDSNDFYLEPVLRAYFGSANTRPYLEIFGGFAYASIERDVFNPPTLTSNSDQGLGFTYGAGIGVEFILDNEISGPLTIAIGAELRETSLDTDDFGDIDQLGVLGSILLGTRW